MSLTGIELTSRTQTNQQWADDLMSGRALKIVMKKDHANALIAYINEQRGFKIKTSEKEGKVTIEKI
jgi:hypothetical protein